MIDLLYHRDRMAANLDAFLALVQAVPDEQARWQPEPGKWSVLEVINHLADEEREDFRTRLELTLLGPSDPAWPPIDPEAWARDRRYNERDLHESFQRFSHERQRSIEWLTDLATNPAQLDWTRAYRHPKFGAISAGMLMTGWLAHDYLHLRQLARVHYQYLARQVQPVSLRYAGDW